MNTLMLNNLNNQTQFSSLYETVLFAANTALAVSLVCITVSILISYPFAEYFSMAVQVSAHIGTIVIAAILKVSYVLRCVAQHGLGQEVR
ncbi:hypothetical protein EU510_18975 [Pseudoalteromonas sp. FUC4]|uniref:hypothetical protein n=1 Tax=Pseudoalteromonas sp. FUC4 TaxID=2511201 RepID=UPI0011F31E57|nr:hypothetical protein [Pseudoalteromonas sp. FUC4]KAA1149896.1 hypothetical protein EU510_18975 [Pseudoalteromonas sp. FUC4]